VDVPVTTLKQHIADVLKEEGFIHHYQIGRMVKNDQGQSVFTEDPNYRGPRGVLRIYLKYGPEGEKVLRHIERASRPGRRLYRGHSELRPVLDGLGIAVLSTSRGVMSDRKARSQRLGGELLCTVW